MNLAHRFLHSACENADKIAVFHGEDRLSYQDLRQQTLWMASHLRESMGIRPGDRVGILLENHPRFIPSLLGILAAGAVAVPINHFLKEDEIDYLATDAGLRAVITEPELAPRLAAAQTHLPTLQLVLFPLPPPSSSPVLESVVPRQEIDLAILIYTSGTTGRAKGAMLSHGNLLSNVESCRQILEVVNLDRFVLMLPMFHSFMLTVCILLPLLTGGSIVLIKSLHPPRAMLAELMANQGSVLPAMAQVFRALAAIPEGIQLPLRLCISGAGPLPASILESFNRRHPSIPLIEGYGLSEASPVVSVNPVRGPWIPGTIGLPIPGVELRVRDDADRDLPDLQDGELCVRGGNVMQGYWNAPDLTRETLRHGWLLTGDIGHRRPDGYFVITDRKKDMLKPNGMNVYPREIEEVIYRFQGIREAAVVGEPDERRGERPVAFVVMEENLAFDEKALLAFLREQLADYKLPRRALSLPSLPRNAAGKILKTRLRELLRP